MEGGIDQHFPGEVKFKSEKGVIVTQSVHYDWKLIICTSCKGYGHSQSGMRQDTKSQKSSEDMGGETKAFYPEDDSKRRNGWQQ